MKKVLYTVLVVTFFLTSSLIVSADSFSAEAHPVLNYDEYFSQRRILQTSNYQYLYQTREYGPSYVNAEYEKKNGSRIRFFPSGIDPETDHVFYTEYLEALETGVPKGAIYLEKELDDNRLIFFGSGYTHCIETCGYLYTATETELRCWNLSTLESSVVYTCAENEKISFTATVLDDIIFFRINDRIYRYYRPSEKLDTVFQHERLSSDITVTANDILGVKLYDSEYFEIMKKAGLPPEEHYGFPEDPIEFYTWLNKRYSKNFEIPTEAEVSSSDGKWGLRMQSIFAYSLNIPRTEEIVWYDLSTNQIADKTYCANLILDYYPNETGENYYPDLPSPWLGTEVQGLPQDLEDEMSLVPTGAYWGKPVTEATHAYTSLGNNQARALLAVLMERKNITRPEERELLTTEGKETIPASEVKTVFESLYGSGSADDMLSYDVIGDANAGDMLLKTAEGDYAYCWAPYAGSELNAEQYIKYLSHETEGDTLNVYTAYGYYRLDDGRETYKLYGDARSLRLLEFDPTTPLATGNVGDGTLTKLQNGELDGTLTVYKHTFVRNADGSYYWASSAPFTPSSEPVVEEESPTSWGIWIGIGAVLVTVAVAVPVLYRLKKKKSS